MKLSNITFEMLEKAYLEASYGTLEPDIVLISDIEYYKLCDPDYDDFTEWATNVRENARNPVFSK